MNAQLQTPMTDDDRQTVITRLQAALCALEHGDHAGWRSNVDDLIQWRTQPLVRGLAKLARELEDALGSDNQLRPNGSSLPDACMRLEHVVKLTEAASLRTLDLIQECGTLLGTLPESHTDEQAATIAAIRARFTEMTAAQSYQDLTGQIILRVVELVRAVHVGLGEFVDSDDRPIQLSSRGFGPSVDGLDAPAATQDDANDLLSSLGI